jgi:lipopolysaccharide export LptBFGC system permease protein LptF
MEDYAAKMALKSDAALREYVTGHTQYREGAVLAALDELQRRGLPAPEDAALRPSLEAAVREQQAAQAKLEKPAATLAESEVPEDEQPVLYTPGVIVLFSVLFNTILAGAVLLALNLRRVNRGKAIWGLAVFVIGYLVLESLIVNAMVQRGNLNPLLLPLLNLPAILLYVLWFWPRYVGTYQFQPRGWLMPLLVCLVIMMGLSLAARYVLQHVPGAEQMLKQSMQQ